MVLQSVCVKKLGVGFSVVESFIVNGENESSVEEPTSAQIAQGIGQKEKEECEGDRQGKITN